MGVESAEDAITTLTLQRAAKQQIINQLEAECKYIDSQIAAIPRPCHLLGLPAELLKMILRFCVVPGKVFVPHAARQSHGGRTKQHDGRFVDRYKYEKPELQLASVCRQIRREATELLLSENLFVMEINHQFTIGDEDKCMQARSGFQPQLWGSVPLLQTSNFSDLRSLSYRMMRKVSISFAFTDPGIPFQHPGADALNVVSSFKKRFKALYENPMVAAHALRVYNGWTFLAFNAIGSGVRFLQLDLSLCFDLSFRYIGPQHRLIEAARVVPAILVSSVVVCSPIMRTEY